MNLTPKTHPPAQAFSEKRAPEKLAPDRLAPEKPAAERLRAIARALRAGVVYVNCYDADDITVPFGGFKQSGTGRDKSLHAFDKYTELKTTWIDLS